MRHQRGENRQPERLDRGLAQDRQRAAQRFGERLIRRQLERCRSAAQHASAVRVRERCEFFDEPALADAGFADHEQRTPGPARRLVPSRAQHLHLAFTADERQAGRLAFAARRRAARDGRVGQRQHPFVGTDRFGHRFDAHLGIEAGAETLVFGECSGPVARRIPQRDQRSNRVFAPGVECPQPLSEANRGGIVAALLMPRDEVQEIVHRDRAQAIAFAHDPVVVQIDEQIAAVERVGGSRFIGRAQALELRDVEPVRCGAVPADAGGRRHDPGLVPFRQRALHQVQLPAQVRPRVGFVVVGKQREGNVFARLRAVAIQQQKSQEPNGVLRQTQRQQSTALARGNRAEQRQFEWFLGRRRARRSPGGERRND